MTNHGRKQKLSQGQKLCFAQYSTTQQPFQLILVHIGPQQKADSAHRTPIVHLSLNHKITNKRIKALCALQFMMPVSVICPLMHYKVYILSCLKAVFKQSIQRVFQLRLKRIQRKSYQQSLKYVLVGLSILRKYFYRNLSRLCNISKFP